ncbi:R3H domain-containing protein 2 [Mortierella hygrophila]|uniref:R3H domain-containing protein 2 n=1 Tax=Mortierella hygrophila TaxID=979708 RepID=A0A9P6FD96_9FUNG|nr:R3H domain-containing protein 2 [Mortierella hygrophila]
MTTTTTVSIDAAVEATTASLGGSLDEVLLTALQNRQDRLFLLKLEGEYCNFIQDPSKDVLEFPWLNSYFRMMIHRSAIYYRLARTVNAAQKKIILSKTEHTSIPVLRFQELVEEEEDVPVKSFKVLRRSPPRPVSACEARGSTVTATAIPGVASSAPTQSSPWQEPGRQLTGSGNDRRGAGATLEQREAAYAKARARIFDTENKDEEEKENNREEHKQPCQDASSTPKGEPRRSPSVTSGTSSPTMRTIASTVDSLSKLDLSQGHGHNKAKSDITRRTSTSSTISSSSSSSGATMADISARTDFVGSWMMGGGGHSMPHPPSGMYDHRSVARNNASYCECGADHGSVGHDIAIGAQYNTPSRRASCACHNHRQQPQESHHHHHPAVCSCQNSHGSSQQSSSSMRLTSSVHGGYPAASALPRHQQQQRQQQLQQQRLFSPCNQQHYPQQYQHHPHQHPHQHPSHQHQHQHQHHPGYQHPVQYGHTHVCARLDPQAQHQHQGHQQHRQPHFNQQYQTHHHQLSHQSHCFIPHHASSHNHHQHNRGAGSSNSGLQDPRWLDCIPRPEMQPSHYNASPANSVSGMIIESNPAPTQDVPPPHPELFQVSVRPYPSSNGYRPCRQGISLPQQMTRQTQQRQHRHPPGQGQTQGQQGQGQNHNEQRQHQQRQQSSAPNTRQQQQQQQQRGQQQAQQHQQQKLSVGSIDHPQSPAPTSSSSSSSSTSYSSSTKRHSHGGSEGRKEVRGASSHTRHHNHRQQEQHHQQQDTIKSRDDSLHVPITVYDVERRPPKSTELYDPYAATNAPACGSGSKSRDHHKH